MAKDISEKTIQETVKDAKNGDLKAIQTLFNFYQQPIQRYCYFLCRNFTLAEDLTQETFISAFNNIKDLQKNVTFKGWLHTIAMRKFLDYKRLKKNTQHANTDDLPEQGIDNKNLELVNVINSCLDTLSSDEKDVLLLVDLAENSYEEAAQIMGIDLKELNSRLRTARNKFIKYCEDENVELTGIFVLSSGKESA